MVKRFLTLLLLVPAVICCKSDPVDNPDNNQFTGPDYEKAAPMIKSGDVLQANSELTEAFITGVNYPDKDLSFTKIFDYPGGFDGKGTLTWDNCNKEWPNGDKPNSYSIRWKMDVDDGAYILHLADKLGWSADTEIKAGSCYVDITNLVPNDEYTYKVSTKDGAKVVAEGKFTTKGHLHQVFFKTKCRNARDLGGWKTEDGKTVKYRKVYRGGRMNDPWETMLSKAGKQEVLDEGIGAELELRGSDDYMTVPAVTGLDHCHPCIEEGGKVMLGVTKPSAKNCAKWLVFDESSPWTQEQKAPYLTSEGKINKDKIGEIVPTNEEYAAFQTAYKAKTKECFMFVYNSVKAGKGVYFHCSLGRDRTGTMGVLILGVLGVREGDISKEYELTYFAPVGFSVSSSDKESNPKPVFKNDRTHWVYSDIVPYFWTQAGDGSFASGVEKYLVEEAGVSKQVIEDFRSLMLE
ncbi:MAG: tyrosine-protein phosphatase [Bacteroidales bacterium]|nr:tyrosine-protein phosphatase [Bacteroidales bacterium]